MANHDKAQVLPAADGLWQEIIQSLTGIDSKIFNGKHQPCPLCGGTDRFRYISKHDKPFFCNVCGAHSPINFYMELSGIDFSVAVNDVGDHLNLIPVAQREIIQKRHIATNSFPNWYKFDFDLYQKIKSESEIRLSPWQRVNALNPMDMLAFDKYTVFSLLNSSGDEVDLMMVDIDGRQHTTGGNAIEPPGYHSIIGNEKGGRVYLTPSIKTAVQSAIFTGKQVVCTWSIENMEAVLNNHYGQECFAIVTNVTETIEADELKLPQLILSSKTRKVDRRVWLPGEILRSKQK